MAGKVRWHTDIASAPVQHGPANHALSKREELMSYRTTKNPHATLEPAVQTAMTQAPVHYETRKRTPQQYQPTAVQQKALLAQRIIEVSAIPTTRKSS